MSVKLSWEETIRFIRSLPEYDVLVADAYFDENLEVNVSRFQESEEYCETKRIIKIYAPHGITLLDIGSGNGISAVSFALDGYSVTSVEPDGSDTIGTGAIRKLKENYKLENLQVYESFAENMNLPSASFDIVYARQCMHHANNLKQFVAEASRVLKPGGLFITVRDHVIFGELDKQVFLASHPLHRFYGGENAFTPEEYKAAIAEAGLSLLKQLKFYDSVINYSPLKSEHILKTFSDEQSKRRTALKHKVGLLSDLPFLFKIYDKHLTRKLGSERDAKEIPGRMYTYIARK